MDRTRNKFLARAGLPGDQHAGVCGSNLRHKREYFLQGARTPDDLVAHCRLIAFFAQSDVLVFQSLFGLLWIRDDYCDASHELPPNLGTLHLARSLCSLRALWSLSRLRTTPNGVADSQLVRGAPSAYIKAGRSTLLGDRELTLPKNPNGGPLFSTWEVIRDAFIRGTLASTNINSLPTKQPGVCRPRARSKHDQTYSKHRPQKVRDHRVPRREDNPKFDDSFQSSRNRGPQTAEQQNSVNHRDELSRIAPRVGDTSKFDAASNQQGKGCGYAQ